ncbi:class I SAM-dependent methyltransferase [Sulfurovum sp. CS9]|uniref:class I SAM-dependent methyltransferase n=1 Tax=Sulfurovum sp. CS9 TaxID=3391146 RepID=UPI0039EAC97C
MKEDTSQKYSRIAKLYDLFEWPIEKLLFKKLRKEAVSYAYDHVLEVGIGTGKNLPYYNKNINLTAIDFSPGMLEIAKNKKTEVNLKAFKLYEMDVQDLKFEDDTFDTVISTFVFCTVPDPIAGLREVYRVSKPKGKVIFLEHMKSKYFVLNIFLYLMNIVSTKLLGTSMIRETQKNIEQADFTIVSVEHKLFDIVRLIIATKS